jgi:hypothetical protein
MKSTIIAACLGLVAGVAMGHATITSSFDMSPSKSNVFSVSGTANIAAAAETSSDLGYGASGITDWTRNSFWQ